MNELHAILFKLLIEVDDICREHDIDYFLSGGTALGAVRNECFIPWDDDIDLFITQENWKKLYNLISNHPEVLPENRDLICIENEKNHRNPIIRYVDTATTRMYRSQSISGKTCGNQLEFFILDPVPTPENGQREHLKHMDAFLELLTPYFMVTKEISLDEYAEHRDLVHEYLKRIESEGYSTVMKELYDKYFTYPLEKAETVRLRWGMRMGLYKAEYFATTRYVLLEGREFPVAGMIEQALRNDYGDTWMYIPKVEALIPHNCLIEDLNTPFKDFTDVYLNRVDQDAVINAYEKNKLNNVDLWIPRREIELDNDKLDGIIAKKEIDITIRENNYNLEQLLKDRNFEVLNQLFEKYYSIQLGSEFRRYNVMIDLDEDKLKIAILNKINQGFYYQANNILSVIEANKGLNGDFIHLKEICQYCRDLSIAIYDTHDVGGVGDLLSNIPKDASDLVDTYRATLWYDLKTAENNDDYESIIHRGDEMLKCYPTDGELMSYIAEAYFTLGNTEKAREVYDDAVHNTRNGLVWKHAKETVGIDRMAEEEIYVN